ncbi:MAG: hypothetical protein LBU76_01980 [Azoarcus sp.]|jgi:hypothetical protein|nr:hypothetical protein [Azoarcus sp.]
MSTTIPTVEQMTSLYLFDTMEPPANLKDDSLIRPAAGAGATVRVDAAEYMTSGSGRFVHVVRFNFVRNFLSGNDAAYIKTTLTEDEYSLAEILESYKIEHNSELSIVQLQYAFDSDDYVDRTYVFNSSGFKINGDAKFIVNKNGTREIRNICVEPLNDNFDFESNNSSTQKANELLVPLVDNNQIGRTVSIEFSGTEHLGKSNFSAVDITELERINKVFEEAKEVGNFDLSFFLKAGKFLDLGEKLIERLMQSGVIDYQDENGRSVIYDGQDTEHAANINADALYANITARVQTGKYLAELNKIFDRGVAIIAGGGNDTVRGYSQASDEIYGGAGDDRLTANGGDDLLDGDDRYEFLGAFGHDIVEDAEGGGISIGGVQVGELEKVSEGVYQSQNGQVKAFYYAKGRRPAYYFANVRP